MTSKLDPVLYTEGMLFKRQRGLKQGNTKKLKFQERFCRLTSTSLDYYDPNPKKRAEGPKGQFSVEQIKIVEAMEKDIFGKDFPYAFQIGDNTEIMYFVAKTEKEMNEWLGACRHVAHDAGNAPLTHHHHGVFGLVNKGRWSCCANPRRACPGCSPSTSIDDPNRSEAVKLTPPSKRSSNTSSVKHVKVGEFNSNATPNNLGTETQKDTHTDDAEEVCTPKIRRFTLADPLMMPVTSKKMKELRKASTEKENGVEELTEDQLAMKGKENSGSNSTLTNKMKNNSQNSLNSLNSIDSIKGEREDETIIDEETKTKLSNDITNNCLKDSQSGSGELKEMPSPPPKKELKNQNSKKDDLHPVANCKKRAGASSPSPSVDSGRGVSRPNSQIDVSDLRVSRTESVGKKSVQSVISDQGVVPDEGKRISCKQAIIEEADAPSRQSGVIARTNFDGTEEKCKNHGTQDEIKAPSKLETFTGHKYINRKHSSPPAPDIMFLQREMTSGNKGNTRPMSYSFPEIESRDSELFTPQHRKLLANMTSKQDRPVSLLLKGLPPITLDGQYIQPYSAFHQACKDGNLEMLNKELNKEEMVNLDEPANTIIPYTGLFIAYINDHYQTMVSLLEHGADPNTVEPREKASLLQWACENGCLDIVDLLIKYKADVNKKDSNGSTPLMSACKNGHFEVVELLLANNANVDDNSISQRTALHEATENGNVDITELLLRQSEVDTTTSDADNKTPYDIAYHNKNEELMLMLQLAIPEEVRPYSLLITKNSAASQMITSLVFKEDKTIIVGSRDCHVKFFKTSDLSETYSMHLTNTVLDISMHGNSYLLLGSTTIQLVDMESLEKRRTVADDTQEDENLLCPPLHLAQFGPNGQMVTASVENNKVKLWPLISQTTGHITHPEKMLHIGEDKNSIGSIYSLTVSPDPNCPWLAVGVQPGKPLTPDGFKLVYCFNLETKKLHHIFDAGDGGLGIGVCTTFSPDGKQLAIGCSEHLCIWETRTGNLLQKFTMSGVTSINALCYSPNGAHLAVGLSSGEVQVFEILSSSPIFFLPATNNVSAVTAVVYSSCGKRFASGYKNGTLRLWEAYIGQTETVI